MTCVSHMLRRSHEKNMNFISWSEIRFPGHLSKFDVCKKLCVENLKYVDYKFQIWMWVFEAKCFVFNTGRTWISFQNPEYSFRGSFHQNLTCVINVLIIHKYFDNHFHLNVGFWSHVLCLPHIINTNFMSASGIRLPEHFSYYLTCVKKKDNSLTKKYSSYWWSGRAGMSSGYLTHNVWSMSQFYLR